MRNRFNLAGPVALAVACSCAGLAIEVAGAEPPLYREEPSDPPATFAARDDRLARTPAFSVTVGSWTSVQVNVDLQGQNVVGDAANEPSIAIDPTDPDRIVIGWRQFDTVTSNFRQAGYAFSTDAGQSWIFPGNLTPGTFRSDPVLDYDSQGNLYYHSLQGNFDVDVFKSLDGGMSWSTPVFAFGGDKNWMAVDRSGGSGDGNVYGVWQAVFGCCGQDIFNRSEDGGQSFEAPVPVALSPGLGTMAVGPDGAVYVAGIDETSGQDLSKFVVARSIDAQVPGGTPTFTGSEVELGGAIGAFGGPNPGGLLGQVNVAVDASGGPTHGNVYVLASIEPDGIITNPIDVMFSRSVDGGATWSAPVRVNDDSAVGGAWHWLGALSVAPNGRLDAIWADTRDSGEVNLSALYYAYSWDAGATWSANVAVSPVFDSFLGWPQQNKIGDYFTMISDETGAGAAYAATFNGEQDVYYIRLFPDCNGNGQSDVIDIRGASLDCDGNRIPDECEGGSDCAAAGVVPDGFAVSGVPLSLDKLGTDLQLTWGASCIGGDTDYEIYEGVVGDFASHASIACSTGGATSATLTPSADDRYYLVVPRNATREGSYGLDSEMAQRPPGQTTCLPQEIGACLTVPAP